MMWFLMCIIAIFIGVILYSKISDQLPEPLQLPKPGTSSGSLVVSGDVVSAPSTVKVSAQAWQTRGDGHNFELSRDFQGSVEVKGLRYDAPTLILTCYEGDVFARIDLHMAAALSGGKATVGTQQWSGKAHELYSPTPRALIGQVGAEKPFSLVLPYAELGAQTVTFNPENGKRALSSFPAACR